MAQHSTSHEPRRGGSDGQDGLVDLMGRLIYSFLGPPALHQFHETLDVQLGFTELPSSFCCMYQEKNLGAA